MKLIYRDMINNKYYVYCLMDPTKPGKYSYIGLDFCFLYEPFYIGKGKKDRIKSHFYKSSLKSKNFKNNKIKSILNKELEVFSNILEFNLYENTAYLKESIYIGKIGRRDNGIGPLCNLDDGGKGTKNCIIESTRKKVFKFDINGNLMESYSSISEAAKKNNLFISDISKCCHGLANTHGSHFWSFHKDNNNFIENKLYKKVYQYNKNGDLINIYKSASEASDILGINPSHISRCCSISDINKIRDFYFRYEYNKHIPLSKNKKTCRVVLLLNNDLDVINEFSSVKEASNSLRLSVKTIILKCKSQTYSKHYLIYKDDYDKSIFKLRTSKKIFGIRIAKIDILKKETIRVYKSISEASNYENISRKKISKNLNKEVDGFIFKKINI